MKNTILEIIINIIGFYAIWSAIFLGRDEESLEKMKISSRYFWFAIILIMVGIELATFKFKLIP